MRELELPRLNRRGAHVAPCGIAEVQSAGLVAVVRGYVIGLDVVCDCQRLSQGHRGRIAHRLGLCKGVVDGIHTNFCVICTRIFQGEYDTTDRCGSGLKTGNKLNMIRLAWIL